MKCAGRIWNSRAAKVAPYLGFLATYFRSKTFTPFTTHSTLIRTSTGSDLILSCSERPYGLSWMIVTEISITPARTPDTVGMADSSPRRYWHLEPLGNIRSCERIGGTKNEGFIDAVSGSIG